MSLWWNILGTFIQHFFINVKTAWNIFPIIHLEWEFNQNLTMYEGQKEKFQVIWSGSYFEVQLSIM